jgi:hypothetical protein
MAQILENAVPIPGVVGNGWNIRVLATTFLVRVVYSVVLLVYYDNFRCKFEGWNICTLQPPNGSITSRAFATPDKLCQ